MTKLIHPLLAAGLAAVVASAAVSPALARSGTAVAPAASTTSRRVTPTPEARACYTQLDDDNGSGVVSQTFGAEFTTYNSRAADDFTLDSQCTVSSIMVSGDYLQGHGPADSMHVVFYHGHHATHVGHVISDQNHLSYTDRSGSGSLTIELRKPVTLHQGHGWVSVRANLDFIEGGEWVWLTNNTVRGQLSQWANPGDGFLTGCITWQPTIQCFSSGEGPDFSFALLR